MIVLFLINLEFLKAVNDLVQHFKEPGLPLCGLNQFLGY